jgi:TonB-linked SusC/RagA family outer membrane protein
MGSFFIEWDILKELTFKTSFNPVIDMTYEYKVFTPKAVETTMPYMGALNQQSQNGLNWTWYNTLSYMTTFGERHNFQALLGTEAIYNENTYFSTSREGYYSNDLNYRHLDAGESMTNNSGYSNEWSLFSIFAKLDYNFYGKYIISGTLRRDGSSRFGENNRYAFFPAFSAAWRLSGERFMQGISFINDMKIRLGWGQTGNQNIGNYIIYDTYKKDIERAGYDISGTQNTAEVGFRPAAFGNPNAKWESTTTANVGLDLTMFNNQVSATIDIYNRLTSDMLMQVQQPAIVGVAEMMWQNIGEMENTGIDVSFLYKNNSSREFNWDIGVNLTHYRNKVVKLSYRNEQIYSGRWDGDSYTHIITEGQPISTFWGYQVLGVFQDTIEVKNAPLQEDSWIEDPTKGIGRWRFEDINENDTINSDDRTYIGSPHPDFVIGIPMNFRYKGFDLGLFWYGSYGNDLLNQQRYIGTRKLQSWGMPGVIDRLAELPQINDMAPEREFFYNTSLIEDGSYLRLNQLILGYNFDTGSWNTIERFRIYFLGNNLLTWTDYEGLDPNVLSTDYQLGFDFGYYPNVKSYMLGINITFQ